MRTFINDRVLVCGGRNFTNHDLLFKVLDNIKPQFIIHGGASGADSLADQYARMHKIPLQTFHAEWKKYKRPKGKNPAGMIRNKKMLSEGQPTLVVVFPGGDGTKDMLQLARKACVPIVKVLFG